MNLPNRFLISVLGLLVVGCADEREPPSYTTTWGIPGADDDTGGEDEGADRFDVAQGGGTDGNGGDNESDSCKKVDLLFVIDDSGSMSDEQSNLINSFPGFIDAIQTDLADTKGYHIGITTTDVYYGNFQAKPGCTQLGVLVSQTAGLDSSNAICGPYAAGTNYMTEADDLANAFQCAARVGTGGDGDERPMDSLQAAVSPALNAQGGCNDGFIRDGALLVVVLITDEEDDHEASACANNPGSIGEPQQWFDSVVDMKGGVESSVVVLSLVGPDGNESCPALDKCGNAITGAEMASRIIDFTEKFTYGFVGRVCEASYDSFFSEAVSVIESACDDFMPQG